MSNVTKTLKKRKWRLRATLFDEGFDAELLGFVAQIALNAVAMVAKHYHADGR